MKELGPEKSLDEIQRSAMRRYFTVEEAVQAYLARENKDSESKMLASEVRRTSLKSKDLKRNFLYLSHHLYCGGGGCSGPLFEEEFGSYCFVGWAHFRTLPESVLSTILECADLFGEIRWLEEEPH